MSALFFAFTLIFAVIFSSGVLLLTWLAYSFIELVRFTPVVYDSWADPTDDNFERIFNTRDALFQVLTIIAAAILLKRIVRQNGALLQVYPMHRNNISFWEVCFNILDGQQFLKLGKGL